MKYSIILIDPAWKQNKTVRKCRPNQNRQFDYTTMDIETITKIIQKASLIGETNHNLFLWTIDKYLFEAEKIAKDLNYKLHARIIWNKTNGVAPGFTVRYGHEYLLWFYKEKLIPNAKEQRGKWLDVLTEKSTKHSQKPEISYTFIESLYPNVNKIELFGRIDRKNWDIIKGKDNADGTGQDIIKEIEERYEN